MAKRKIVLLVVEGASDASLLVPAFSSLIENRLFQGQEFHCDVLTAPNHREEFRRRNGFYPADNPAQTVRELVEYYLRDHDRAWGQLGHVIQICDLDGAFTSDDRVREDPLVDGTQYSTTDIITPNRTILIADRTTKRNGVDALLKLDGFRKKNGRATLMVPYRLFYVSRNLEHAFRGRIDNLDAQHKQSSAIKLADRFTRNRTCSLQPFNLFGEYTAIRQRGRNLGNMPCKTSTHSNAVATSHSWSHTWQANCGKSIRIVSEP